MKVSTLIKLLVGVSLLFLLYYKIGFSNIYQTLITIHIPLALAFVIIFYILFFFLGAWNLKILLDPIKKLSWRKLFEYYCLSWSFGLFVPAKLGEFSLIFLLKKEDIGQGQTMALSVIDKFITMITFAAFAIIGFLVFFTIQQTITFSLVLVVLIIGGMILLFSKKIRALIQKMI